MKFKFSYLTISVLALIAAAVMGCEDPTKPEIIDSSNPNNLPIWEEIEPEIPPGVEQKSSHNEFEINCVNWINDKIEELEFTLNLDDDGSYYIYPVTYTQISNYWSENYNQERYACFVQYLKDGVYIREFISAPIPIAEFQARVNQKVSELKEAGYSIFSVDTQELFTDEGTFVVFYVYYYPDVILNTLASSGQQLALKLVNMFSAPEKKSTEEAVYGLFNLLGHENAKSFVPGLINQIKQRQVKHLQELISSDSRFRR